MCDAHLLIYVLIEYILMQCDNFSLPVLLAFSSLFLDRIKAMLIGECKKQWRDQELNHSHDKIKQGDVSVRPDVTVALFILPGVPI